MTLDHHDRVARMPPVRPSDEAAMRDLAGRVFDRSANIAASPTNPFIGAARLARVRARYFTVSDPYIPPS
jgi:hypothetical protein